MSISDIDRLVFYRRVQGIEPNHAMCTSQIELSEDRTRLLLRLASTAKFTVSLDTRAVSTIVDALIANRNITVGAWHDEHEATQLLVEPYDDHMSLYVRLRNDELRILYPPLRLAQLITHLEDGRNWLNSHVVPRRYPK